jgi:hypothetical protein
LETQGLTIAEVAVILLEVKNSLSNAAGETGAIVYQKFNQILEKNPGFSIIREIGIILSGGFVENFQMPPNIISCYKFVPLTSTDVERSFSIYKSVLSDRRARFTPENLEMYLIIHCFANVQ